ncbi:MAG: FKBP-type peptidyl-prolyl cis-trans isomerase [Bacteroidota bacterium]
MGRAFIYLFTVASTLAVSSCLNSDDDVFDINAQFQADLRAIDEFILANGIDAAVDDRTGIRYVIQSKGDGLQPVFADSLTISYIGKVLADESTFDTVERSKRNLAGWLQGVLSAVSLVQEGGSITAYVPSRYGFGSVESNGVPANSPLILEIDFHELHYQQLRKELLTINDSLTNWQIEAETHSTGIRFIMETGTGSRPAFNGIVEVNYEARLFGKSESVDAGRGSVFEISRLIQAWQIMIPEMQEGGSMTIYVPSVFAYGSEGTPTIPPNTNMEFDIELISVN